jgi:hypothetical protein
MTIGLGSFAVQPLWWSYKYKPDRECLEKTVYPPLRAVAIYCSAKRNWRNNVALRLNPRKDYNFNDHGHYTEQFATTMCVSELLLQSVGDVIRVFPAWPADKSARFADLRAQSGRGVTPPFGSLNKVLPAPN